MFGTGEKVRYDRGFEYRTTRRPISDDASAIDLLQTHSFVGIDSPRNTFGNEN